MSNALKNKAAQTRQARVASPQTVRTPGRRDEVKNNAGGFTFNVSERERLERFLILGTDGGTFYVKQGDLTDQNLDFVKALIKTSESMVIDTLVDVAVKNRAPKNSPSLYTLALVIAEGKDKEYLRGSAVVSAVVRTGTHLFEFCTYIDSLGGWGRAKRSAVAGWYEGKTADQIAYQAVKYRQREGWTHRDVFRKVHPVGVDKSAGNFILGKPTDPESDGIDVVVGFERMQKAGSVKEVIAILGDHRGLPWETIPTQFLTDADVWKTLFYNGAIGQTALLRNASRFSKIGAFDDMVFAGDVAKALADEERIKKGRVHPVAYANALGVYRNGPLDRSGMGYRTEPNYDVNSKIAGALEAGFYNSFATIEPANKRTMIATDVSGSMTWGAPAGLVGMNYMEAAAVMAMVTLRTEPYAIITAFADTLQKVGISDADSFETVMKKLSHLSFGGTDVSAPMRYAKANNLEIDHFIVYSDMETWAGDRKVFQALKQYRNSSGINARLSAVGLASTSSTVADPQDKLSMNVVGFDSAAPKVLADFGAGRI